MTNVSLPHKAIAVNCGIDDNADMNDKDIIAMVVQKAGGMRKLGRMLGIRYQVIQNWKRIPAVRVIELENILDIPREQLRPDLYPPARNMLGLK